MCVDHVHILMMVNKSVCYRHSEMTSYSAREKSRYTRVLVRNCILSFFFPAFHCVIYLSNLYVFICFHPEQTGAWGCFDEFNRINIEVLSVVAQQILSILSALSAGQSKFHFDGQHIRLVWSCGIFITMNPGRSTQMCKCIHYILCHHTVCWWKY